tara:strand:+ start:716 stop:1330 length:615 start_codon:yes stop_codon:yes gene_type:complete
MSIPGYYINLDSRVDRKGSFESIKEKVPFLKNVERYSAFEHTNGAYGCGMSHINVLKKCLELEGDVFIICEDDLLIINENNLNNMINTLDVNQDWDIITLTPRGDIMPGYDLPNDYIRINNNQTTTGYIIKRHMIPILIKNLEEAVNGLINGGKGIIYSIDQYWKRLQNEYKFYYYKHIYAGQLVGFSNIEKRFVNYNERYIKQ